MAYTVKKLAAISGVSVRTLHWYDEVGLLKPACHSANGYRLYEEAQLLTLQQFWTPDRESYAGHGQLILDSELRQAYEKFHPALPEFAAAAIQEFAARELA